MRLVTNHEWKKENGQPDTSLTVATFHPHYPDLLSFQLSQKLTPLNQTVTSLHSEASMFCCHGYSYIGNFYLLCCLSILVSSERHNKWQTGKYDKYKCLPNRLVTATQGAALGNVNEHLYYNRHIVKTKQKQNKTLAFKTHIYLLYLL